MNFKINVIIIFLMIIYINQLFLLRFFTLNIKNEQFKSTFHVNNLDLRCPAFHGTIFHRLCNKHRHLYRYIRLTPLPVVAIDFRFILAWRQFLISVILFKRKIKMYKRKSISSHDYSVAKNFVGKIYFYMI